MYDDALIWGIVFLFGVIFGFAITDVCLTNKYEKIICESKNGEWKNSMCIKKDSVIRTDE